MQRESPANPQPQRKTGAGDDEWLDLLAYLHALIERPAFVDLHGDLQEESERDKTRGRRVCPIREVSVHEERRGGPHAAHRSHAGRRSKRLESVLPANARSLGKRLAETGPWALGQVLVALDIEDYPNFRQPTDMRRFWRIADSKMAGHGATGSDQKWFSNQLDAMNPARRVGLRGELQPDFNPDVGEPLNLNATHAAGGSIVLCPSAAGYPQVGRLRPDPRDVIVELYPPPLRPRGRRPR